MTSDLQNPYVGDNNTNITNNNYSQDRRGFVNFIKHTRPSWFVPNECINIDDFHKEYLDFGLLEHRNHFSKKFRNILWDEKRNNPKTRKMEYRCLDLWL